MLSRHHFPRILIISSLIMASWVYAQKFLDIDHGPYTSVSYASVVAHKESELDLNPRTVPIDGKAAFTFMDGYQFNPYLAGEIGVTHMGVASDVFSLFAHLRSPVFFRMTADLRYGISFANNLARKTYGMGVNVFATPHDAVGFEYNRLYSYTQQEALNSNGGGVTYPTDWHTDIKYMQPLDLMSLKYTHFMGECKGLCRKQRPEVFAKGDYVGLGVALLSRHLSHGNYRNNPLAENVGSSLYMTRQQNDDMLGYSLVHGKQITPHYGLEFGVSGSSKESYLNFYTAAARFVFPVMDILRPYGKIGMLYTNETDFGWTLGLGADIFVGEENALGLAWERMDVGDPVKQRYYDLATLSARHYFGVKEPQKAATPSLRSENNHWLALANQGKDVIERGLYYGLMLGAETGEIKEVNLYHKVNVPLDGVAGITMFGYGAPVHHKYYLGAEGYLGRSGAVHRPQTDSGDPSYDDLYIDNQYNDESYFKDYYFGGRLIAGLLNSNANLAFLHAGVLQGDFSIITNSGLKLTPKYRDRHGAFFFSNADELKGTGYMQRHAYQLGMGHEIPITSKVFLRMEYNFTRFKDKTETPTNPSALSYDDNFTFDFRPKSDQFLLGMKVRLGSERVGHAKRQVSQYTSGWYTNFSLGNDYHHIRKRFGVVEPSNVRFSGNDLAMFGDFNLPRSFFADGLTGQASLSKRWLRHRGKQNYVLGVEGAWAVLNAKYNYQRHHNFDYKDSSDESFPQPNLAFNYRIVNKGMLGFLLGYEVNPEDMLFVKAHYVSSLFKRGGFEGDFVPGGAADPNMIYRYFGSNFSRRIDGWQFTLGNDFSLNRSFGLTLACAFTRYNSMRIEDDSIVWNQANISSVKNNYHNYRVTDTSYLMGLRYRIG